MADPLTTVITVLSKTDGRDKIYKTLAGVLCYYAHVMNVRFPKSRSAQSALEMAKSITSGRSLMRLGKWMENIRKLIIALQTSQSSGLFLCAEEFLEFMRVLFDMIYVLGDNIAFFRRHEFLYTIFPTLDMILRQARIFQFWAFLYAVMLDTVRLYKGISLCGAKEGRSGNVRDLQLNLIKNTADLLVSLNMVGYASKLYRPTAKTTALLAVLSGSIATYQNVRKVMPSQRFLKSHPRDDEEKPTSLTMLR